MKYGGIAAFRARILDCAGDIARRAALDAQAEAMRVVPYGDGKSGGHLRDNIRAGFADGPSGAAGWVRARSDHAAYVEFGTSRMRAQPYLSPAFALVRNEAERRARAAYR